VKELVELIDSTFVVQPSLRKTRGALGWRPYLDLSQGIVQFRPERWAS